MNRFEDKFQKNLFKTIKNRRCLGYAAKPNNSKINN